MNDRVREILEQLVGKPCWGKRVGRNRSLSLGFGEKVYRKSKLIDELYGEWEVGTYYCAWRIIQRGTVVCGSQDSVESIDALNTAVNQIAFGKFALLRQSTNLDVRVEFDNETSVDFLATISDDNECFHVFCPANLYIEFSLFDGWKVGKSNKPWQDNR